MTVFTFGSALIEISSTAPVMRSATSAGLAVDAHDQAAGALKAALHHARRRTFLGKGNRRQAAAGEVSSWVGAAAAGSVVNG